MNVLEDSTILESNKQKRFEDRVDKNSLIPISEIKTIFKKYNHENTERYGQSMVWYDVGCLFFLIYIKKKYKGLCTINICEDEIKSDGDNFLEWIENIDCQIACEDCPKYLIYYKKQKFHYDPKIILKSDKLQIHIVSHSFLVGSGHLGCIFIKDNNVYYYDPNGLQDPDEAEYYDIFEKNLSYEMKKFGLVYIPYRWKRGIQRIQESEELKYGMDIMGMCCAWTFLFIELKLMNPTMSIEDIENKIKKKYRFRLTRMIVTYQQEIHNILFSLANEYYK